MKVLLKYAGVFILFNFAFQSIFGGNVDINVDVPANAYIGDQIVIRYDINRITNKISLTDSSANFKVSYGPSISSYNTISTYNGDSTMEKGTTFMYGLVAQRTGVIALPQAIIMVDSIKYVSKATEINVLALDSVDKVTVNKKKHFAKLLFSSNAVYKQEPIIVQLKVYSTSEPMSIDSVEMPKYDDFLQYDFTPTQIKLQKDTINGIVYNSAVLSKLALIPLKAGDICINKVHLTCNILTPIQKEKPSLFDRIFDSGKEELISLITDSAVIHINNFPEHQPLDFNNISGKNLVISTKVMDAVIFKNRPFELNIEISGNANLRFMCEPDIHFPAHFELIKKETCNNSNINGDHFLDTKIFHYEIQANKSGIFTIPSFSFSYLDLDLKKYKRLTSKPINVKIQN